MKESECSGGELGRYHTQTTSLQETKWLENSIYRVGRGAVLAAGSPMPGPCHIKQRGEGVGRGAVLADGSPMPGPCHIKQREEGIAILYSMQQREKNKASAALMISNRS